MRTRYIALLGVSVAALLSMAGFALLTQPTNPILGPFRGEITNVDSRIVIGPYPTEDDFKILSAHQVTTIVTMLDPNLPYERVLLDRERGLAKKYGMTLLSFPMTSILGQRMGGDYQKNADAAADAVIAATGKVYLHCYLGIHRVKVVEDAIRARGGMASQYAVRQGVRSEPAKLTDRAQSLYDAADFKGAIEALNGVAQLDDRALLLRAWATYRTGDFAGAQQLFENILKRSPNNLQARNGVGFAALQQDALDLSERSFGAVLKAAPQDPPAVSGMGLVRYRQGRYPEATRYLRSALELDPSNEEAKSLLATIAGQQPASASRR